MAQTTGQVPLACGTIDLSTDGCKTWIPISGETQSVAGTEQIRKSGEAYTLEGDTALLGAGKREPMELTFAIVYTEIPSETYELIRAEFEAACGSPICVRWSPKGGNPGDSQISTGEGIITGFIYPPMDASAGGPIMAGFTLKVASVSTAIVAS